MDIREKDSNFLCILFTIEEILYMSRLLLTVSQLRDYKNLSLVWGWIEIICLEDPRLASWGLPRLSKFYYECEGKIEKSVPRSPLASRGLPKNCWLGWKESNQTNTLMDFNICILVNKLGAYRYIQITIIARDQAVQSWRWKEIPVFM